MEDFQAACAYVAASPFHLGQNDRGWVATLDYVLQPGKATELAEKATARPTTPQGGTHGTRPTAHHHRSEADERYLRLNPITRPSQGQVPEVPGGGVSGGPPPLDF